MCRASLCQRAGECVRACTLREDDAAGGQVCGYVSVASRQHLDSLDSGGD